MYKCFFIVAAFLIFALTFQSVLADVPTLSSGSYDYCEKKDIILNAAEERACRQFALSKTEAKLKQLTDQFINQYKSLESSEATKEEIERFISSQNAWLKYRDDYCFFGYYTKSSIHSSSQHAEIVNCKLIKTTQRIEEIISRYISSIPD